MNFSEFHQKFTPQEQVQMLFYMVGIDSEKDHDLLRLVDTDTINRFVVEIVTDESFAKFLAFIRN